MPAELHQGFQVDPAELPSEAVIFGSTAAMLEVRDKIECAREGDFPVLLQGESGTGKDLVARFLHARSSRHQGPFVKLSCAAISPSLLEGELLGYEEGSFPGSSDGKRGLVEIADGGTLYIDDVGEMGWTLHRKLLHLLQNSRYFRVGGREERQASVRVVCATNVNLAAAIKKGAFRRDLFHHMDVMCLRLSALRERKEDIPQLWDFFTEKLARRFGKRPPQLTPEVLHVLEQWNWPGNLCELENCIARVIILGDEEAIGEERRRQAALASALDGQADRSWRAKSISRQAAADAVILQVLQANRWNQRKTAGELKRTYRSLLYRLRNAGVAQRPRSRRGFLRPE
jgi:two-component system, NtrC family, response regulator AtoC